MLKNLIRRKPHQSPRAEAELSPAKEERITRSFVIKMVLIIALAGPAISVISPFVDQAIRNKVDDWMSEADLFDSISISPDDYAELPPYWRQTLAEIALRPKEEAVDAQNIIKGLKLTDIGLVDLLAPYAISNGIGILRDEKQLSEHPMPELSYRDFSHLEDLGILEDVNNGITFDLTKNWNPNSGFVLNGATVALRFKANDSTINYVMRATAFTRGGWQLIEALRVPSNISYFEWFAQALEKEGFTVELFARGAKNNSTTETKAIQARIERHSILAWPH